MRNLLTDPLWQANDLGTPIPESPHACSVALPLWEHVIGYEEEDPDILGRLRCGYPRFFCNRLVRKLFEQVQARDARDGESALLFPSRKAAERCAAYVHARTPPAPRIRELGHHNLTALFPASNQVSAAMEYWRYSGEIVTSRQAEAALDDAAASPGDGQAARTRLRERLASQSGQDPDDVFLFPCGMAAVFAVHRAVQRLFPGRKSVQLEFPYVDVLRVQREFGDGVHFYPLAGTAESRRVGEILRDERLSAVFCELASNPLMRSADVETLVPITRAHDVPLIVDDTIASSVNIDAFLAADAVTTSLTKFFSGTSDVMAGSVILRHDSPFRDAFAAFFRDELDDTLWDDDAVALEANSRDYPERMRRINRNAEAVFDHLVSHPKVESVYYPKSECPEAYRQLLRSDGGYGGLISVVLRNAPDTAPRFYDALRVSKGPSLGTNFTLACPYTLLAHYRELDWAASCGCPRELIRISVGLEDPEDLIARLEDAFAAAG